MNALLLTGYMRLEMAEMPLPEVGPEDVLVRVRACGICGSDVHGLDGSTGRRIPPLVMGHEAAGEVAGVGERVAGLRDGTARHFRFHHVLRRLLFLRARRGQPVRQPRGAGRLPGPYRRHGAFAELRGGPAAHRLSAAG